MSQREQLQPSRRWARTRRGGATALWYGLILASAPHPAWAESLPPGGSTAAVARFALVIGNNQPEGPGTAQLRYADDDAVSTHGLLLQAGVTSVLLARLDEDTRRLHPEATPHDPPRGTAFDSAIDVLFARIAEAAARGTRTELLIFYSGHGDVSGGEGYVLLEDRRLMRSDLHALLSRSPAHYNHVFVDACKSYFLAFERAAGGRRTSYARSFATQAEPGGLANVGFVLSTSSDRDSHEWERFQAGILSYELRSALRGAADADGDGRVTYAELGAFLTRANDAIQNPRFRPDFLVRPPRQNLAQEVLGWNDPSTAVHLTPRAASDHIYIENARGERIVDVHAAPEQTVTVHLPRERPLFVRRHDESSEYVIRNSAPLTVAAVDGNLPAVARRGALHLAFEQLFATTFGAEDVRAFERNQQAGPPAATADVTMNGGAGGRRLRWAAGGAALVGITAGLVLNGVALQRYVASAGASQRDVAQSNGTIHRLNLASLACYAVAAAAGITWGSLTWHEGDGDPVSALARGNGVVIDLAPAAEAGAGFALSLGGAF